MWMMPLTRVVPFPHIWLGACDYSSSEREADLRLWNIWGYHRRDMTTTWFSQLRHLTWTPDGYAGETGYRDHIIVETHVWGAPAFPAERMPSGSRPIGEEAFVRTPPTAAVWLPPHEKPKPELTSQATIMFSTHRNHERWKWIAVDSSHSMSG